MAFGRGSVFADPLFYLQIGVIGLLCLMILYPAAHIFAASVRDTDGSFSLRWFQQAYTNPRNYWAILNTIAIASGAALVATVAGTFLAWAVVRTDMPGRRLIEMTAIVPFITTPFLGALSWVMLANPTTGLLNQLWVAIGASGPLLNIYSLTGIIFVEALYEMPFVFLMVAGALRSMDPTLEEAALSSGASLLRTTFTVTLPLALPAILGGAFLVFALAAEQFGVPAVLGAPSKIRVLTTSIIESEVSYPPRHGLGAALCITLLVIALGGLWLQRRALGKRSYTTVSGKGSRAQRIALPGWRWVICAICLGYIVLSVVLPVGTLVLSSIRTMWTADIRLDQFTLQHYRYVLFDYPITHRAVINSLFLAVVGATVTILLCALISVLSQRTKLPGRRVLDYLSMLPLGFPGVVLAFGLLQAWINPPIVLYGTIWILFIAYATRYLPVGVRATSSTLMQIHPELEEASLSCGAGWFRTFRSITLPLLKPGIIAGWALLFVAFTRELSASVLLYSPTLEVFSVAVYDLAQAGSFRALSALAVLQIIVSVAVLAIVKKAAGVDRTTASGH
jgi:iron(III) transport system permease protein